MKEEERIEKLKTSLESLIEDYLGKDINNYQKLGVKAVSYTHLTLPTNREV